MIGVGSTPIEIPDPTAVRNLLAKLQRAVGRYSRVMLAKVDDDDAPSIERFRKAVAIPIDRYRSTRSANNTDVDPEEPIEPTDPAEPDPGLVDPTEPITPESRSHGRSSWSRWMTARTAHAARALVAESASAADGELERADTRAIRGDSR